MTQPPLIPTVILRQATDSTCPCSGALEWHLLDAGPEWVCRCVVCGKSGEASGVGLL